MKKASPEEVRLPRVTKGKRPHFFDDPSVDQLMTFILELMTEVSVLRERLDVTERLLDARGVVRRTEIEDYEPTDEIEQERIAWREAYLKRVLRLHIDDFTPGAGGSRGGPASDGGDADSDDR